ncbi:MAG TPA: hypothetical protein VG872_11770 [Acidimicrobiia bacterium]|jgi:hypothetical protein|nr:hypothetical protein [Acidimicrobiia bacterium]
MFMPFRSHLARSFDFALRSNQAIAAIVALAAVAGVVVWVGGEPAEVLLAPVHAFTLWALVREIDPDHQWSALLAAVSVAVWALVGGPVGSPLPAGGLAVAGRLMTATTGRRPLLLDMAAVSVIGVAIGFTVAGWVAGFGVALALYLDDRFAPASRGIQLGAAAVTAIGATVVAAAAGAFPETMPAIVPYVTVAAGLLALGLVVREPSPPTSRVDARYAAPLDQTRLHVSRTTIGVLVFLMTIFLGAETEQLLPILGALLLVVISNELEPKPRDRR